MTTDAERECYYRLARSAAGKGAIIELGAWLGASTAYLAAGVRDSGVKAKVHTYDKFQSKPAHKAKVKAFYDGAVDAPVGHARDAFNDNLGPLLDYVKIHEGQIEKLISSDAPIALLVCDAPKRVKAISAVLTRLHKTIVADTVMAWQDFCHFPSYEIPACLYRIRRHIEFVEGVVPGTTMVFRVTSPWKAAEVSEGSLAISRWTATEATAAWNWWVSIVPAEKRSLFLCGLSMLLCDIGHQSEAREHLGLVLDGDPEDVIKKWRYLHDGRPDFVDRYKVLFELLGERGYI